MSGNLSVVIPAYNEEGAIAPVLAELLKTLLDAGIESEIIVVDDGSTDQTAREARRAGARVLRHRSNRGYGAALKTGILAAKFDKIAITDADGTYPARYLPSMLSALENADMVTGARTGKDVNIPLIRRPAKWTLNRIANFVAKASIPDLNSGLRVFRREVVLQYFPILPDQFSWTTTITLAMHCDKYAVKYVPIDYLERTGKSKIVPWDAATFATLILRTAMLFHPLRVFMPIVIMFLAYGSGKAFVDLVITRDKNISASAALALLSALFVLLIGMLGDAIATRLGRLNRGAVSGVRPNDVDEWHPDASDGDQDTF